MNVQTTLVYPTEPKNMHPQPNRTLARSEKHLWLYQHHLSGGKWDRKLECKETAPLIKMTLVNTLFFQMLEEFTAM